MIKRKVLRAGVFRRVHRRWRRRRRVFAKRTAVLLKRLRRTFKGLTRYNVKGQLEMLPRLRESFRYRFTGEQFYRDARVAPFTFLTPTREKFVSDEEKHRHATAKQTRRREHYRKTSHLVALFTEFVPQLLQKLIERRVGQKPTTYIGIRRLVAALY